jgi:hypothetical protein
VTYVTNPERVQGRLELTRTYLGHLLPGADCLSEDYERHLRVVEKVD